MEDLKEIEALTLPSSAARPLERMACAGRFWAIVIAVLLVCTSAAGGGLRIARDISIIEEQLRSADGIIPQGNLQAGNRVAVDEASTAVEEARRGMRMLERDIGPLLAFAPALGHLPGYGGDIHEARDILAYTNALLDAVGTAIPPTVAILERAGQFSGGLATLDLLAQDLEEHDSALRTTATQLEKTEALRAAINVRGTSVRTQTWLRRAEDIEQDVRAVGAFGLAGPDFIATVLALERDTGRMAERMSLAAALEAGDVKIDSYVEDVRAFRERTESLRSMWSALRPSLGALEKRGLVDRSQVDIAIGAAAVLAGSVEDIFSSVRRLFDAQARLGLMTPLFGAEIERTLDVWAVESQRALGALDALERIADTPPDSIFDLRLALGDRIGAARPGFERLSDVALASPQLLGLERPLTILVLGQDDHEMRPTGGFIGSVMDLEMRRGTPEIRSVKDSYAVDPPQYRGLAVGSPAFWKYMAGQPGLLTFRDVNWEPDFPRAAEQAIRLYGLTHDTKPEIVVALDTWALVRMMDVAGDIQVPGIDGPVEMDEARTILGGLEPYPCGPDRPDAKHNRCFSEDLAHALLEALRHPEDPTGVAKALFDLLETKHLLMYSGDPETQDLLNRLGWDGSLRKPEGDYLMAVDWTAYSKAHDSIDRSLRYDVTVAMDGAADANLSVRYVNSAPRTPVCIQQPSYYLHSCYWNYLRVFTPQGITLSPEDTATFPLPPESLYAQAQRREGREAVEQDTLTFSDANGRGEIGAFMVVNGGETLEARFAYRLPPGVLSQTREGGWRYRLNVQKQPGTVSERFDVTLRLPAGSQVIASSEGASVQADGATFSGTLERDVEVWVEFRLPS